MVKSGLRGALLVAAGKQRGVTAGFDRERVLIPSLAERERLLVLHRIVADLLAERPFDLVNRLVRTDQFSLQLAVLRGTVLALALSRENALEGELSRSELAVDEPSRAVLSVLDLDAGLRPRVVSGFRAYCASVRRNPDLRRVPAIDVVVRLLTDLDAVETSGAALAAATVYQAQLRVGDANNETLYHEQLALMTAFLGADAVTFRNGHLHIV